ncbi:STAS domain-containing protein [Actinoplanes sp. NPDC049681]|uniref:STAS domain-containing protein n=1 Tax=Actinoplanes sp. NPDC049681 TaxID=3363905 RepID=UPI003795EDC5
MASTDIGRYTPWPLSVTCTDRGDGTLLIRVIGELDACVVSQFRAEVAGLVKAPVRVVELDLDGVRFCDAAGVRELLTLRHRAAQQQIMVALVAAHPAVQYVLGLVGQRAWLPGPGQR